MTDKVVLRTAGDRLRYTIAFEITLMLFLIPVGAFFFDKSLLEIGLLAAILSGKAMVWGFVYNWVFDLLEARTGRVASERTYLWRVVHAVGFEISLTLTSLPIYTVWLCIDVLDALSLDIIVTTFVVAYTFIFTLVYDRAFPLCSARV